jgi:hypothetical protein
MAGGSLKKLNEILTLEDYRYKSPFNDRTSKQVTFKYPDSEAFIRLTNTAKALKKLGPSSN